MADNVGFVYVTKRVTYSLEVTDFVADFTCCFLDWTLGTLAYVVAPKTKSFRGSDRKIGIGYSVAFRFG